MLKQVPPGLLTAREMAAKLSNPHEDDYTPLTHLHIQINPQNDTFLICFWIYLMSSTVTPATLIHQVHADSKGNTPFLVLNKEKKLVLFPFICLLKAPPLAGDCTLWIEVPRASTEIECPFDKWVHVGCEVSLKSLCLYIDGVLEEEKSLVSVLREDSSFEDMKEVTLDGAHAENVQEYGYVHCVRCFLPEKTSIQDHIVKNPPVELLIDTRSVTEIEEDADGVWSIISEKASCSRNLSLDVVLLDGLGNPVNEEIEVFASLVYADDENPVKKPNGAEAPHLTNNGGTEFASFLRPSKLLHGRASFKFKISQLSSKCENRLIRIRLSIPKTRRYPFFETYSSQIRCISRNSTCTSSVMSKKSTSATARLDESKLQVIDLDSSDNQHISGDEHLLDSTIKDSMHSPPPKRVRVGAEKSSVRVQADPTFACQYDGCSWTKQHQADSNNSQVGHAHEDGVKGKLGNIDTDNTPSDSESVQVRDSAIKVSSTRPQIPDLTIFRYCLGDTNERYLILKEVATIATDFEMTNFAQKVSLYTGCSHHWYTISIAKRLLKEGSDAWDLISQGNSLVLWDSAYFKIGEQFRRISSCYTRGLQEQDFELLRAIAGCQKYMNRENFDRLWCWLYPVAFTLSREEINAIWGCKSTLWIDGLISKEEAESSLQSGNKFHQPGTFILRFPTSRSWPHPDAGNLVVTYVGNDLRLHHRLLSLDYRITSQKPLEELLLEEPHLTRLGRVITREQKL